MPGAFVLSYNYIKKRKIRQLNLQRRQLRDDSNPMSVTDERFIELYRVNKEAFSMILNSIAVLIQKGSVPEKVKLAATLCFLAVGSFQGALANETHVSVGRSTMSKILWETVNALESILCPSWISLNLTREEKKESKVHFFLQNLDCPA